MTIIVIIIVIKKDSDVSVVLCIVQSHKHVIVETTAWKESDHTSGNGQNRLEEVGALTKSSLGPRVAFNLSLSVARKACLSKHLYTSHWIIYEIYGLQSWTSYALTGSTDTCAKDMACLSRCNQGLVASLHKVSGNRCPFFQPGYAGFGVVLIFDGFS